MEPESFSTLELPAAHQLEAWRGWYQSVFEVAAPERGVHGFRAENQVWQLDGFSISLVSAPSLRAVRTRAMIRQNPVDHWVLTLGQGATRLTTRDACVEAPEGVPFILSLGDEVASERERDRRLQFYLPRDGFRELAPLLDNANGRVLDSALGRLLGEYMQLLHRRLPEMAPQDSARLAGAVRAMVEACIAPSPGRLGLAADQIGWSRMEKVRQTVRRHLRSASLGPAILCRQVGMSRSQLYRLLESEGGVARYIQRQRLVESYAVLSNPGNTQRIGGIAEELCFADASTFSRAFRQEFGVSPTDARAAALAGVPTPPKDRAGPDARSLSDCLRSF